jgi:hypothetical protein
MVAFTTKADAMLPKFVPVEQQWRANTEHMRGGLARQQSIYGGGQAAVARGQITVALNQAAIQANQIHRIRSPPTRLGFQLRPTIP